MIRRTPIPLLHIANRSDPSFGRLPSLEDRPRLHHGMPPHAPPPPSTEAPRRPGRWLLALAGALGLCGLLVQTCAQPSTPKGTATAPPAGVEPEAALPPERAAHAPLPSAPPPPPACPAGATCGRVFDEADEGIASATVTLGRRRAQLVEVTTDAQGVFVLGPEIPLEDGPIWLDATAPGFVPLLRSSRELPLRAEDVMLRLHRGAVLLGQVVRDDNGEPVAGAEILVGSGSDEEGGGTASATTDAAGRFRLDGLDDGACKLTARALGLFAQGPLLMLSAGVETAPITLRVKRMPSVRGRLVFASSQLPCAGGEITLRSKILPWQRAEADAQGRVVFPVVLPGKYRVDLSCEDHVDEETAPPLVVGATDRDVVFALHEKLAVRGIVVDGVGAPVAGVGIGCSHPAVGDDTPEPAGGSDTGPDGRFTVRDLEPGAYDITLDHGFGSPTTRVKVARGGPVPEVRLVYDRVRLRARVVDESGLAVPSASLSLLPGGSDNGSLSIGLDDEGRFDTEFFGPGFVRLKVQLAGAPAAIVGGAEDGTLDVGLPRVTDDELVVVVRAPAGVLEGTLTRGEARGEIEVDTDCSRREDADASATVGPDGRFVLRHLTPDAVCDIYALAPGGESALAKGVAVGSRIDLVLRPAARLHGTLVGSGAGFTITADGGRRPHYERFLGTNGAWSLGGLPPGSYVVQAEAEGMSGEAKIELAPGEDRELPMALERDTGEEGKGGD